MLPNNNNIPIIFPQEDNLSTMGSSQYPVGGEDGPATIVLVYRSLDRNLPREGVRCHLLSIDDPLSTCSDMRGDGRLATVVWVGGQYLAGTQQNTGQ